MHPAPESTDDASWPSLEFLLQLRLDQLEGRAVPLRDYLARYPQHELEVAREFLLVRGLDQVGAAGEAGADFGPFQLLEELGRGGEGTVYLAHERLLGRRVALKVLAPRGELDEARALRAAALAARLQHPALVPVLGAGRHQQSLWVATAWIDGTSLAEELQRRAA